MKKYVRAAFAWTAMVWLAAACSLQNTNQVSCTADLECVGAFGAGAVCQSDGFCVGGSAGGDDDDDGTGDTDGGPDAGDDSSAYWTFVSFPDFLNADVGDVSALTSAVNSTNAAHEAAIAAVLDAMAAEQPDFVLVAGDLVNGHWYADADGHQVFGPVGTLSQKQQAVDAAADLYYSQWKQRFAARGLTVYPALGDHDVGDNNWPAGQDKSFLVPTYKQAWARHFTKDAEGAARFALRPVGTAFEDTAYAVRHKNVLVVTTDVFRQDDPTLTIDAKTGSVRTEVVGDQLAWLESVLADAATDPLIDHVIVQGHVPVLVPVRRQSSSGLTMPGGGDSQLWQALARHDVDLYLAGEVHDMSAASHDGVEQVVHGGIMGYAPTISYLVGRVYPDRIELELKHAELVYPTDDLTRLWQAGSNRPRAQYSISPTGFTSAGTLLVDKRSGTTEFVDATGYFVPLGSTGADLAVHLPFDESSGSVVANHGTTGTTNNGAVTGATFVAGKVGNGVQLDGADHIEVGPAPVMGAQTRSTSVWVRVDASSAIRTIFTLGTNTGGGKWDTDIDATGLYELGIGQGRTDATGSPSLADGAWHHVVTVLPEGATTLAGVRMYVDGAPIEFTASSTTMIDTNAGNLSIGQSANAQTPQQFSGGIDDFALWTEELDAGQVRALYSFASEPTLAYDAGEVDALFTGFEAKTDVTINGRLWRYQASGLTGTLGQLTLTDGTYAIDLGLGAGFVSP